MSSSSATTRSIRVDVRSHIVPERSDPAEGDWFFVYHVRIANEGKETVQLLSRHWVITDGKGRVEEVRGPGVVGKQPVLKPGEAFRYTSACPLHTPFGIMHGTYQMQTGDGDTFDAEVAAFQLGEPPVVH